MMCRIGSAVHTLFALALFAQTTASLTGIVTSAGKPLPGVTVTVRSDALQGSRTAKTSEAGAYDFAALPPGQYKVTVGQSTRTAEVRLAQTARLDVDFETVTADAPSVLDTPEVSTNLTLREIERLPLQRNQLATVQFAPGVNPYTLSNGVVSISGGPGYDNLVLINGVVVTENVRGQMRPMYVEDAIEETTVLTGAISAEYGRFSGGVVSTITKSGGNTLSGSLRDSLSSPAWSAQTLAREQREHTLNHVWEATLGGPVMRDRLWFFTAGRWAKNDTARQTISTPPVNYTEGNDQKRYEGKLTGTLADKHTLAASYFGIDTKGTNVRFNNNVYDLASLTTRDDPESLGALHYDGLLTPNVLLEGHASARKFSDRTGSFSTDLVTGTLLLDRSNSNARFNSPTLCGVCDAEHRNNDDVLLKAHAFVFGSHDVVGGVDRFTERRYANNHQSGSDFSLFVSRVVFANGTIYPVVTPSNAQGGGTFIRWNPVLVPAQSDALRTDSAFLNDVFTAGTRWSFSAGLRWDRNHAEDADGVVSSNDRKLAPRLSAQFDLRGDGRQRVSASYAEYASRIADSIASSNQAAGNAAAIDFAYKGPSINDKTPSVALPDVIRSVFDYFNNQQGGTANRAANNLRPNGTRTIPGYSTYFDGTLASPYVREMTVGYGAQLGANGFVRADAIRRDWRDFYAASVTTSTLRANTPLGIPVDLTLIRNSNNLKRAYRALQLQARWTPPRIDAGVHYTLSTLRGNDDGESGTAGAVANTDPSLFYPEFFAYDRAAPVGYLQGDQRHRLRAWLGYDFPRLTVTVMQSYDSGLPYSIAGPINLTRYVGAPANPGYNSIPNGLFYFSGRGALRTDDAFSTDVALRTSLGRFFLQADVLNIFNNDAIVDPQRIGTTVTTAATSTALQPFDPRTQTPILGTNYQPAANFGQALNDLAYQRPRTVRFSVGARF
jgi:hypothetical protein